MVFLATAGLVVDTQAAAAWTIVVRVTQRPVPRVRWVVRRPVRAERQTRVVLRAAVARAAQATGVGVAFALASAVAVVFFFDDIVTWWIGALAAASAKGAASGTARAQTAMVRETRGNQDMPPVSARLGRRGQPQRATRPYVR